ncbi:hypothetical protein BN2476_530029 [Paraburkholderia piptadeniae]|uniref:Uncharacterized protein n=1 Tax=Paraburkholderia piptadeniae TaxID=1701573 RepID=A0A1N7SIR9_9BURK|nr:hypothetical protein BN2476_530029 [Paraburkholderia piptadeniae]
MVYLIDSALLWRRVNMRAFAYFGGHPQRYAHYLRKPSKVLAGHPVLRVYRQIHRTQYVQTRCRLFA